MSITERVCELLNDRLQMPDSLIQATV